MSLLAPTETKRCPRLKIQRIWAEVIAIAIAELIVELTTIAEVSLQQHSKMYSYDFDYKKRYVGAATLPEIYS